VSVSDKECIRATALLDVVTAAMEERVTGGVTVGAMLETETEAETEAETKRCDAEEGEGADASESDDEASSSS
jgi:hypothetical protein